MSLFLLVSEYIFYNIRDPYESSLGGQKDDLYQ